LNLRNQIYIESNFFALLIKQFDEQANFLCEWNKFSFVKMIFMEVVASKVFQFSGNEGALYGLGQGMLNHSVFSCGSDKVIRQWDLKNGTALNFALRFPMTLYSLLYVPDKNILVTGTADGTFVALNLHDKSVLKEVKAHRSPLFDLAYSKRNNCFVVAASEGSISFIDAHSFELKSTIKLCIEKVRCLALTADESELAIACGDGSIRIFDMATLLEKVRFNAHQFSANSVIFHPDGKHLISGGKDAMLSIWERNLAGEFDKLVSIPAHNFAIYSIVFHPNGKLFATASRDKTIKIWDATNFNFLLRISKENQEGHINSVNKIYWSDYNNYLVSTGDDRSIITWKIDV
jgi:WD40 repeat protein